MPKLVNRRSVLQATAAVAAGAIGIGRMWPASAQGVPVFASRSSDDVVLGAVYDMAGPWQALDVPSARGAQIFVDRANSNGGVLGRRIELVVADAAGSVEGTTAATTRLLLDHPDVVSLFGLSDTDVALAAAEVAAASDRMFVTSGATSPKLPAEVPGYLFMACFGDNVQAAAAASFATAGLGAGSASIAYDTTHTYTQLLHQYFADAFTALGGDVRSVVSFDGTDQLGAAAGGVAPADVIFLATESATDAFDGVTTLRSMGFGQPILGGDGYDGESIWDADASISDVYYTTHAFLGAANPSQMVQAFRAEYVAAHGVEPSSFAGLGYDTAGLLVEAVRRAGSTDPAAVLAAFATIQDYRGLTGSISYPGVSRVPLKSVTIMQVASGVPGYVREVLPSQVPTP